MYYKFLLLSLICIKQIQMEVTLYPNVSKLLPPNMHFEDNEKTCFNRYFEYRMQYQTEEKIKWNCSLACHTKQWCCMRYSVMKRMFDLRSQVPECKIGLSQFFVDIGLNRSLADIQSQCKPMAYQSNDCQQLKDGLQPDVTTQSSQTSKTVGSSSKIAISFGTVSETVVKDEKYVKII